MSLRGLHEVKRCAESPVSQSLDPRPFRETYLMLCSLIVNLWRNLSRVVLCLVVLGLVVRVIVSPVLRTREGRVVHLEER
jgi:hypothetical protein